MAFSIPKTDLRIKSVACDEHRLTVELMDGRSIAVPLAWCLRLFDARPEQRDRWELAGGGYGIHWTDLDEDLSVEGLLKGAPAPKAQFPSARPA
ncbi:hypothetical protein J2847_003614 [Azospirillum agricola]|uniref:DUF2442 domain-containing protein n=1 Tax=Azospirillum agricola TaxID=1720247 RepID=UPI001AE51DB0|nr:DUF2442 domain-containing protein [Azospirillum agricola]MBP2230311.1 hypothetical protein [Azospirillum agricola]